MNNKLKKYVCLSISLISITFIIFLGYAKDNWNVSIETFNNKIADTSSSLEKLIDGNKKFVNATNNNSVIDINRRKSIYENGQKPYAIILTCSDSRVAPEHIFNAGLGDLFVIRVAGNVVDDSIMGSIEFAVDSLKVPLIMVMGHGDCGAVYNSKSGDIGGSLGKILSKIAPSYEKAQSAGGNNSEILKRATDLNVENSINIIKENQVIKEYIQNKSIEIVGSYYNLETGEVSILDIK